MLSVMLNTESSLGVSPHHFARHPLSPKHHDTLNVGLSMSESSISAANSFLPSSNTIRSTYKPPGHLQLPELGRLEPIFQMDLQE